MYIQCILSYYQLPTYRDNYAQYGIAGRDLVVGSQIAIVSGFSFGSSVWDCHVLCEEILVDFNLAVRGRPTKSIQYTMEPLNILGGGGAGFLSFVKMLYPSWRC